MQKNLESLETSIMELKRRKYERDLLDYEWGEVYTWSRTTGERTPRSILRRNNRKRVFSGSSIKYKTNFSSPEKETPDSAVSGQETDNVDRPYTISFSKQSNEGNTNAFLGRGERAGNTKKKTGNKS